MGIVLTLKQEQAAKLVKDWYEGKYVSKYPDPNVFTFAGIAGAGKTSCIFHVIENLGLTIGEDVIF